MAGWIVLSALALWDPRPAFACACCADPGYRREVSSKLSGYERGELERVRFSGRADVYQNASDDPIPGIAGSARELALSSTRSGSTLTWKLSGDGGKTSGTLTLTLPSKVDRFYVDARDTPPNQETVLYKEWRFSAKISASGDFKSATAKGTTARLVLQGRGNVCDDATMFTHWTLVVKGPKADYTLYGALGTPGP